jgi:hypothetical protein
MGRDLGRRQLGNVTVEERATIVVLERVLASRIKVITSNDLASSELEPVAERPDAAKEVHDLWLALFHQLPRKTDSD